MAQALTANPVESDAPIPPLRICIPIHSFEPGGVERVGLRLADHWQAVGHEVTVVLRRDRGIARPQAPALDYRTRPEPLPWETPWLIWCLWRYLRRHHGETAVIFCAGNTYTVVCAVMKLLLGRERIATGRRRRAA